MSRARARCRGPIGGEQPSRRESNHWQTAAGSRPTRMSGPSAAIASASESDPWTQGPGPAPGSRAALIGLRLRGGALAVGTRLGCFPCRARRPLELQLRSGSPGLGAGGGQRVGLARPPARQGPLPPAAGPGPDPAQSTRTALCGHQGGSGSPPGVRKPTAADSDGLQHPVDSPQWPNLEAAAVRVRLDTRSATLSPRSTEQPEQKCIINARGTRVTMVSAQQAALGTGRFNGPAPRACPEPAGPAPTAAAPFQTTGVSESACQQRAAESGLTLQSA